MARPKKKGLEYFTNDVNFYQDIKIRKLIRHKGIQAVSVYHILLCQIYSNGYYIKWDEDLPFILSEVSGLEEDKIIEAVTYCLEIGLLDSTLYESEKVLTSRSIQERYIEISVAAKRKLDDNLPYLLVDIPGKQVKVQNTDVNSELNHFSSEETLVISEETQINSEESTQSKEKERKEKHSSSADIRARGGETAVAVVDDELQVFSSVDEEIVQLRASPIWKEQVLMRFKFLQCNEQTLFEYLDRWGAEVKISGKQHYNLGDAKHHFCNWMIIQEGKLSKTGGNNGTSNNNGYRTSEDILTGAVGIINELRAEGAQPKRKLPVV